MGDTQEAKQNTGQPGDYEQVDPSEPTSFGRFWAVSPHIRRSSRNIGLFYAKTRNMF